MLLCSAYFAISQFPAYTELIYFTVLKHVLSLEMGLPEKGHQAKSDIDRPDNFNFYKLKLQEIYQRQFVIVGLELFHFVKVFQFCVVCFFLFVCFVFFFVINYTIKVSLINIVI